MKGKVFRKFAEHSHSYYELDEWIFIRELIQNSRDSGCDSIEINAFQYEFGYELISFSDNGCGMDKSEIDKFLFRLYSSSKETEENRIGMFGVGFWTVLRFKPIEIKIETVKNGKKIGVSLDKDLNISIIEKVTIDKGTKIVLKRKKIFENKDDFVAKVGEAVKKYGQFATGIKKNRLIILFNKKLISKPLSLDEKGYISFEKGDLKGVVGFSKSPKVTLLKGGIPLWNGRFLEELTGDFSKKINSFSGPGLAPAFLIDGDGFESVISRKNVKYNKYLNKAVQISEKALNQLVRSYSKKAVNGKSFFHFSIFSTKFKKFLKSSTFIKYFFISIFIIGIVFTTFKIIPIENENKTEVNNTLTSPLIENSQYKGAKVDSNENSIIGFKYSPPEIFRFIHFKGQDFNNLKGFVESDYKNQIVEKNVDNSGKIIDISLNVGKTGEYYLPVPEYSRLLTNSLKLNNKPTNLPIFIKSEGYLVTFPQTGIFTYSCLIPFSSTDFVDNNGQFLRLPDNIDVPKDLFIEIEKIAKYDEKEKVKQAIELTLRFCKPINESVIPKVFENSKPWLENVIESGVGDCDVVNGLFVFILRKLNIPSNLVIGFIGANGEAVTGYHAWAEYYLNGWKVKDLSISQQIDVKTNVKSNEIDNEWFGKEKNKYFSLFISNYFYYPLIIITFFCTFLFIKKTKKGKIKMIGIVEQNEVKWVLAELLVRAIIQPDLWKESSEIYYQRVIPSINGKVYSLNDLKLLGNQNKLFSGSLRGNWPSEYSKKGFVVLNKEDKYFKNLISILHGIIDLDQLEKICNNTDKLEEKVKTVEENLNNIFKKIISGKITIILTNQPKHFNYKEVKLVRVKGDMIFGKLIILNINQTIITDVLDNLSNVDSFTLLKIGSYIINKSDFFKTNQKVFLKKLSETILMEFIENE